MLKSIMLILFLIFISSITQAQSVTERCGVLIGTWKIENKDHYEVWEKVDSTNLKGYSYQPLHDKKRIIEYLSISEKNNSIIYEATVPTQNEGKPIPFKLNQKETEHLSFENPSHDFPKKIIYKIISKEKLFVQVLGAEEKGFSFYLIKQ